MANDPYTVLGVPRDASEAAIKAAWRKLARQHHPDLNPGKPEAEARFSAASAAHDLLSDPERRARFDRGEIDADGQPRAPAGAYGAAAGGGYGGSAAGSYGGSAAGSYRRHAEAAQGTRYSPGMDAGMFEDIFADIFEARGGDPFARDARQARGQDEAYRLDVSFTASALGTTERLTLPDGRVLNVTIPPGLVSGQVLRLRGQGGPAGVAGAPAGDAMIEVRVADHPLWRREGRNVLMELPVSLREAVLGGPVEVPTPAGRLRVTLPAGSDSGRQIRLRGKGVAGDVPGDFIVTPRVVIGPPDAELEAFLRDRPDMSDPRAGLEPGP